MRLPNLLLLFDSPFAVVSFKDLKVMKGIRNVSIAENFLTSPCLVWQINSELSKITLISDDDFPSIATI